LPLSSLIRIEYPSMRVSETALGWNARWACFRPGSRELLCVGDQGRAALFTPDGVQEVDTGVRENLRCAAFSPDGSLLLCVGNSGLLMLNDGEKFTRIQSGVSENLRRVVWAPDGSRALIIGNGGTALLYHPSEKRVSALEGAHNNLRGAAWPQSDMSPIIVGNAFAGPFIPSPNIYHLERDELRPVAQVEKVDLIGVDWCASRGYCVTVGYDVVWHEPKVYIWRGQLEEVVVAGKEVYPTTVSFHPEEDTAVVATGYPNLSRGRSGTIFLLRGRALTKISQHDGLGFTCAAWDAYGREVILIGSRTVKTFNT
jgi:WD40 repeat protein